MTRSTSWKAMVIAGVMAGLAAAPCGWAQSAAVDESGERFASAPADSGVAALAPDSVAAAPDSVMALAPPAQSPRRLGLGGRARRAAGNFLSDGWVIVSSPFRARGMVLVWAGAVIGAEAVLYVNDQAIMDASLRNADHPAYRSLLDIGETLEPVGFMGRTNLYYVAALGAGYAFDVRFLRTIPTQILESHLLAGGLRNVGKLLVGREHPYQHHGPYVFRMAHGTSFPSGHTSVVFELATIASMNIDRWPVTIVAYGAATTVALQRIQSGNHWASDVLISAVYGTLVSRTVVNLHRSREAGRRANVALAPQFSSDGRPVGVRLTRSF